MYEFLTSLALFVLVFAIGAWCGFREGQTALENGQASTLAELRASLARLRSWLDASIEEETVALSLRETRAMEHYIRDLEVRSRGGKWIVPFETRERK